MYFASDLLDFDVVGTLQTLRETVIAADDNRVPSDHALQHCGRIDRLDFSMIDNRDLVAVFGFLHVMRGHEDGRAFFFAQRLHMFPNCISRLRIQAERGFIQKQNLRMM